MKLRCTIQNQGGHNYRSKDLLENEFLSEHKWRGIVIQRDRLLSAVYGSNIFVFFETPGS